MANTWEVEQKFVVEDAAGLLEKLSQQGFELSGVQHHCDVYFRHPCRDFRATDEAFRVRQIDTEAFITYKGQRTASKVKTRPEIELGLQFAEVESWKQMLGQLGFSPLPPVQKIRKVFEPNSESGQPGCVVTLDDVEQLGLFAEIELIVADEQELEWAQRHVEGVATRLGLVNVQPQSYLSQLLEKLEVD